MGEWFDMTRYILDTNYLLRFLLADNPVQYKTSVKYFELAKNGEISITIPLIVFIETNYVLVRLYRLEKAELVNKLLQIVHTPYVEVENKEILVTAFSMYKTISLSLTDILIYVQSIRENKKLLTFDKKLLKLSKSL